MAYLGKTYLDTLYQPTNNNLTALAGITYSANIQSLLASADYAAARTNLGLAIGTNVQAYDADLTTWAGITPASGIGTFLATPSSANLKSAVTDETGSGGLVFADTPTLITPILGAASATTLTIGTLGYTAANFFMTMQSSVNSYNQLIIRNSNNGATASSDLVVNNDQSTDTTFYGDFGMNSNGFTGAAILNQPNYVYLTATSTDLAIGTTTSHGINFVVNNGSTANLRIGNTGTITIAGGETILAPCTTTYASLNIPAGTVETATEAGDMEHDGKCLYFSSAASSRQVNDCEQFVALTSTNTLTSQQAAQPIFDGGGGPAGGALTVQASTSYYFECEFSLTSMSSSSGSFGFAFTGTATFTSQGWMAMGTKNALATSSAPLISWNTAANTAIAQSNTTTTGHAKITGIVRINAGGTLIPSVSLGVAAAAVVGTNSYFRIWPIGSNTVATCGNWSQ